MKAQILLEDHNNNFDATKDALVTMVMALANAGDVEASIVLNTQLKLFKPLQNKGKQSLIGFIRILNL